MQNSGDGGPVRTTARQHFLQRRSPILDNAPNYWPSTPLPAARARPVVDGQYDDDDDVIVNEERSLAPAAPPAARERARRLSASSKLSFRACDL